jgi:hypothetical protein
MKQIAWKWLEDGAVDVAGVVYKPSAAATVEALNAYGKDYSGKSMVFTVLFRAKLSFETGQADYAGARQRLPGLLLEYGLAEMDLEAAAHDFGRFFEPGEIYQAFGQDSKSYGRFIVEAIGRLGAKSD